MRKTLLPAIVILLAVCFASGPADARRAGRKGAGKKIAIGVMGTRGSAPGGNAFTGSDEEIGALVALMEAWGATVVTGREAQRFLGPRGRRSARNAGITHTLPLRIGTVPGGVRVGARLVDTSTGEVAWADEARAPGKGAEGIKAAFRKAIESLAKSLKAKNPL